MIRTLPTLLLAATLGLAACSDPPPPAPASDSAAGNSPATGLTLTADTRARLQMFQQQGSALLGQLHECAATLVVDTRALLEQPIEATLATVRQRWQTCQQLYQASLLLEGMNSTQRQHLAQARNPLGNPLELPGYIDSIEGYPFSGIVNDATLPISESSLRQQHGLIDQQDVSTGFEVVAFLLWGEFRFNPALPPRPPEQLATVQQWDDRRTDLPVSEHPHNRRRAYLELAVTLLRDDCKKLLAAWEQDALPSTEDAARQWQLRQWQQVLTRLDQHPDNPALQAVVSQWLGDGALTGVTAAADTPGEATAPKALRNQVQAVLDNLLKARG